MAAPKRKRSLRVRKRRHLLFDLKKVHYNLNTLGKNNARKNLFFL